MNFLQIIQKLHLECDVSGNSPTTTVNQTGEIKRLVEWAKDAYLEIQERHKWKWLRYGFTLSTSAADDTYSYTDCIDDTTTAAITRFRSWHFTKHDPPKIYLTSAGKGTETWLSATSWNVFKTIFKIGSQVDGFPSYISINPQNSLILGARPNGIYTISGDYIRSVQTLSADNDVPEMPSAYHNLIVYMAMQKYGFFHSSQEVLTRGERDGKKLMRQLELDQLDPPTLAEPLV